MESTKNYLLCFVGLLLLIGTNSGCTSLPRNPVPLDIQNSTEIPGMQDIRALSGLDNVKFEDDVLFSERQYRSARGLSKTEQLKLDLLVLSGGADYGAFGAGLLNGWTQSGPLVTIL